MSRTTSEVAVAGERQVVAASAWICANKSGAWIGGTGGGVVAGLVGEAARDVADEAIQDREEVGAGGRGQERDALAGTAASAPGSGGRGGSVDDVLPAMSDEAIFEEVIVAPRKAFPPLPDLRVIERPGWLQIVTPSINTGGFNEVAFSALDEADADRVIDATIATYRELGLKFRWNAGPGSAPADLGGRLERRGLVASWGRGMARATTDLAGQVDGAIVVEEIEEASVGAYSRVMAEGWGLELASLTAANRLIAASPAPRQRMFLARWDGEPAAVASYVAFPRSAYLRGGVVLPRFRGRGLYRALVQARLADTRARGVALATSHAREATSAPILERLGFATICRFPMYFG